MSQINIGFDNNSPQAIDRSYGSLSAAKNVPYSSVAAAVATINAAYRYRGKTVIVDDGSTPGGIEYWWRVGTADNQLVPKINSTQSLDFVVGDGGTYTPADQATILTNPALVYSYIEAFQLEGQGIPSIPRSGFPSWTYNSSNGQITLTNTKFAQGSWYSVKFRQL